jgi:hypothetical protein
MMKTMMHAAHWAVRIERRVAVRRQLARRKELVVAPSELLLACCAPVTPQQASSKITEDS